MSVMRITIFVDKDYNHLEQELNLDELGDLLRNQVQEHIQGMVDRQCPEPRVYIMTDAESDQ